MPMRTKAWPEPLDVDIIGYMKTHTFPQDGWWHERPTKAADLRTEFQPMPSLRRRGHEHVWRKALLVAGLMFGFELALLSTVVS